MVKLKYETKTTLSYTGLAKRAEWMGYAANDSLASVKWKKLEESLYGVPFYRRRYRRGQ